MWTSGYTPVGVQTTAGNGVYPWATGEPQQPAGYNCVYVTYNGVDSPQTTRIFDFGCTAPFNFVCEANSQ